MARRAWCPTCERKVGLMTPPMGPTTKAGPPRRVVHGNPNAPRRPGGRMAECAGSRLEADPATITDTTRPRPQAPLRVVYVGSAGR